MDKQKRKFSVRDWIKILFWLFFLAFFIYSFRTIMDLDGMANPIRQKQIVYLLTALSRPNLLDGETFQYVFVKMWETFQTAFLATTISAILAIPITLLSAYPSSRWGRVFKIFLQPFLSIIRAIHPVIVAIPMVVFAGIGPTSGVLALTFFSSAVLIGNFSDYAMEHRPINWITLSKKHFPALTFKHLPVNILIATILGYVGGGGIGFLLFQQFNLLDYQAASATLLAIIVVIGSIDLISRAIWRNIQKTTIVVNPD